MSLLGAGGQVKYQPGSNSWACPPICRSVTGRALVVTYFVDFCKCTCIFRQWHCALERCERPAIPRVHWEPLAGALVRENFDSHLLQSFNSILRETGELNHLDWWVGCTELWLQVTPEAADRDQQAKGSAVPAVAEAKTEVWEEFDEAMEQEFWLAFWQTIRWFRKEKLPTRTIYCRDGELLTSTEDMVNMVRWWKEYFEALLNPTDFL